MIITAETPRMLSEKTSGGGKILSTIGLLLFGTLLVIGAKEYVEYRMDATRSKGETRNEETDKG